MKVLIRASAARLQRLSPTSITVIGLLYLLVVAAADAVLPDRMAFTVFYLFGVAFVGWYSGKWSAMIVVSLAAATTLEIEGAATTLSGLNVWVVLWNISTRLAAFIAVGWLALKVTWLNRHLSDLVEERTAQWKAELEQHKATTTRLAETLERFEQVANNITEVFWLSNVPKSEVSYVSPAYERIWGRKCADLYRDPQSWVAALHPDDREAIKRRSVTEQSAGGYDVEYRVMRPDGGMRWIRDRAFPVRNNQGEVYRIAGIAEDITERKRTEELLQMQARVLASMAEAVVMTDEKSTILLTNPALHDLVGYEAGELEGQLLHLLSSLPLEAQKQKFKAMVEQIKKLGPVQEEYLVRRKDGRLIEVETRTSGMSLGGRFCLVLVGQDITARKQAEETLRQAHDKLETRVQERTAQLHAANAALAANEERLQLALDASRAGTWSWDVASNQSMWDRRYQELYGFQPQEPVSFEGWIARVHPEDRERLLARIRTLVERGEDDTWNEEFRALHPVKGERWMAGLGRVERDPSGRAVRMAGLNLDITERKAMEHSLRGSEARYRRLHESITDAIASVDMSGRLTEFNPAFQALLGYTANELRNLTYVDLTPAKWHALEAQIAAEQVLARGYSDVYEKEYCRKDGTIFPIEMRTFLIRDAEGQPAGMWAIVRDITRRKQAEAALREAHEKLEARVKERTAELEAANAALSESEERYRSLVTNLNVGVYRSTPGPDGRFLHVNPALALIHGCDSVEELQALKVSDTYQEPDDRKEFLAAVLRQGSVVNYELRLKKQDGTPVYGSVNAAVHRRPDGEADWIDGVVEDITERKKAQQRLAESWELNRTLVSASTVGIAVYKASGRCVIANEALARITGGPLEQLLQQDFRHLKSWRTDGLLAKAEAALATWQPQELETESRTTFGREVYINARFVSFESQGEQHLLFMVTDETQAERAHQALLASEERYRTLAESSPDAIFILNRDIRVDYVNSKAAALWRRKPEDLIGLTQADLFSSETARNQSRVVSQVFETGASVHRDKPLAFPVGNEWIEIRLAPMRDAQGMVTSVMGICRDITERKRAEQQLAEALDLNQKMIAASTTGIAAYKATGECVFANSSMARILGGSQSEVLQGNFRRLESWRESRLLQLAEEALSQGQARSGEFFCTTRFGKAVSLDCHLAPFVSNGQPHLLAMALDISERKRAEEELKMQSLVLQNMAEGTLLTNPEQTILFANSALESMFGYGPGELNGKPVSVLNAWPPEETARFNQVVMRATEGGRVWQGHYENRRKDGTVFTSESRVIRLALGGQDHFISVQQDITDRKRAESLVQAQRDLAITFSLTSDLQASLKRLLAILIQMGELDSGGVYLLDGTTGGMRMAVHQGGSPAFVEAVSYWAPDSPQVRLINRGEPIFARFLDLPLPHDEVRRREGLRGTALVPLVHEGKAIGTLALSSHVNDEIPRQTQLLIEAIAAQAAGAVARIRAEAALRESETRLRAIITGAPVLLFAVDQEGIIRFEDGQALKTMGVTTGANLGRSVIEAYAQVPTALEHSRRALRGEQFEAIVEAGQNVFDCWYSPTRDKDGKSTGYIGVATNITERHRLELQILEISDREQARIGQDLHDGLCQHLVSLAFDANSLQGQLAAARRPEAKTARRIADYLDQAITEARQLSRGLFPVRMEKEGLPSALEELARTTRERFGIPCHFDSKGPAKVKNNAVATHLYRIAQEAVTNAVKHSRATKLSISLQDRPDQIELRVEDNGAGITPATRGKATGMGLHIMDYRARTIGGTLRISAGQRRGTKVSCCVSHARQ